MAAQKKAPVTKGETATSESRPQLPPGSPIFDVSEKGISINGRKVPSPVNREALYSLLGKPSRIAESQDGRFFVYDDLGVSVRMEGEVITSDFPFEIAFILRIMSMPGKYEAARTRKMPHLGRSDFPGSIQINSKPFPLWRATAETIGNLPPLTVRLRRDEFIRSQRMDKLLDQFAEMEQEEVARKDEIVKFQFSDKESSSSAGFCILGDESSSVNSFGVSEVVIFQ
jgi:hypothetical protein